MNENRFTQFGLSQEILDALDVLHYTEPTEIQEKIIPLVLEGKDVLGKSQTGSGKTAAFGIPLCERVTWEGREPQALVLEPTRELAVQVSDELFQIGRKKRLKVPAVFGGFPIDKQIQTLRQKTHIVVGTPGRIMDHVRRETISLASIQYLVIDEADLMLDMGFFENVKEILSLLPKNRVSMLFSATLNETVQSLVKDMNEPISIKLENETETVSTVEQRMYEVLPEEKYRAFLQILKKENPETAMIFCGTRDMVKELYQKCKKDRIRCGLVHGELEQKDRIRMIQEFREGRFPYLICTDVAARGVDFEQLSYVINYDFPTGKETYVHRIGRTGRKGYEGVAISLVTDDDEKMCRQVEEYIGEMLPRVELVAPTAQEEEAFWKRQKERAELKPLKGAGFNKTIMRLSISGGKKVKMRTGDIVGTICSIEGIASEDIGVIDIRDSLTYVEILNGKGSIVRQALQDKTIKGKVRKVKVTK